MAYCNKQIILSIFVQLTQQVLCMVYVTRARQQAGVIHLPVFSRSSIRTYILFLNFPGTALPPPRFLNPRPW